MIESIRFQVSGLTFQGLYLGRLTAFLFSRSMAGSIMLRHSRGLDRFCLVVASSRSINAVMD